MPFEKASFDFVLCNAVIQHLSAETTEITTIPELTRVLAPGGVLQLMFKIGFGVATVSDRAYGPDSVDRSFQLYDEYRLLKLLEDCNCSLIEPDGSGALGGMLILQQPQADALLCFLGEEELGVSGSQGQWLNKEGCGSSLYLAYGQLRNSHHFTLEPGVGARKLGAAFQ